MAKIYSAKTIAKWFINRAIQDVGMGGEYITNLKLQKLLYYAQGTCLAINDDKLFSEKIIKWTYGPVVTSVYGEYKECQDKGITKVANVKIDNGTESILEEVYQVFGQFTAYRLSQMTHEETPWQKAEHNKEIDTEEIKAYFKQHYVA